MLRVWCACFLRCLAAAGGIVMGVLVSCVAVVDDSALPAQYFASQ